MSTKYTFKNTDREPAGWKDGLFYPDGPSGKAFGIQLVPIRKGGQVVPGEYAVIFPVIERNPEAERPIPELDSVHKLKTVGFNPEKDRQGKGKGRPKVQLTPTQLSILNKDLSIRKKAAAMGISPTKVHQLMQEVRNATG